MKLIIFLFLVITVLVLAPTLVYATNAGSYIVGFWKGSSTGPLGPQGNQNAEYDSSICKSSPSNTGFDYLIPFRTAIPAVTNTTACENGFFSGWKNWCNYYPLDCISNMTVGIIPPMVLKTHQEYQRGYIASNGSYNLCPIGENNAFCTGWYNNVGERYGECGDNPNNGTFASHILVGCPLDIMTSDQMVKPHLLIGTWGYVNGTMLGKIVYSDYGNFTLTIPVKNIYGDYKLEGSWGSMGPGLLTECYSNGNCDNNTLHVVTPNFVKFADIHNNMISLTRVTQYPANLIGARLIDNLLSQQNHNGIVLPAVNFPGYIDLSNPAKVRPNITVINDPTYQQRWNETREMNSTATTWTIYNTTSGSTGTIKFTDCVLQNETGYLAGCPNNPPTYYRILHGHLEQGVWAMLYPLEITPDKVLELCPYKDSCINLVVQQSNSTSLELLDSHNDKLYLTGPTTPPRNYKNCISNNQSGG